MHIQYFCIFCNYTKSVKFKNSMVIKIYYFQNRGGCKMRHLIFHGINIIKHNFLRWCCNLDHFFTISTRRSAHAWNTSAFWKTKKIFNFIAQYFIEKYLFHYNYHKKICRRMLSHTCYHIPVTWKLSFMFFLVQEFNSEC